MTIVCTHGDDIGNIYDHVEKLNENIYVVLDGEHCGKLFNIFNCQPLSEYRKQTIDIILAHGS